MKKYWYIISMALVFGMTACSESIVEEPANSGNTTNGKLKYCHMFRFTQMKAQLSRL
jgi:hypothetical protein